MVLGAGDTDHLLGGEASGPPPRLALNLFSPVRRPLSCASLQAEWAALGLSGEGPGRWLSAPGLRCLIQEHREPCTMSAGVYRVPTVRG